MQVSIADSSLVSPTYFLQVAIWLQRHRLDLVVGLPLEVEVRVRAVRASDAVVTIGNDGRKSEDGHLSER